MMSSRPATITSIAVEHGLERQPPVAHRSEHAPDHRRPARTRMTARPRTAAATRRPIVGQKPIVSPGLDEQGDLGERQGDENEQRRKAQGREHHLSLKCWASWTFGGKTQRYEVGFAAFVP